MRVLSEESAAYYSSRHPCLRIIVQPNMMDLNRIIKASERTPSNKPNKPFIFYVGRLVRQKNIEFLIDAFDNASKHIPHDLIIIGYGPLKGELVKQANNAASANRIHFLETSEHNYWYMKEAAIFPMTSIWEGHPLTMIEAMSLGTPVISLDFHAGPKHLIGNNERGVIVKERSPTIFSMEIVRLINDSKQASALSNAALEFVSKELDIKNNFHEYINTFVLRDTVFNTKKEL
jgi:glycosyltransferase involved in cell wall biosynthesis